MENGNCLNSIQAYQNSQLSNEEIITGFIVRQKEYELIISEIKRDKMNDSIQHFILVGRRGSGKSTLIRRIKAEIETENSLNKRLITVYLPEEQAGIYKLHDLCDMIIESLTANTSEKDSPVWSDFMNDQIEYTRQLYIYIQSLLKKQNKKLVLLLDNIDRIFDNIGDEAHLLREWLSNYKDWRIIGGSTRMREHYWKYEMPFYQFFRITRLDSLNKKEVRELLIHWGNCLQKHELESFAKNSPGKLDTIRLLTDGMPRTLLHFVELLIDRSEQRGFDYLKSIVDKVTPLYQERLNRLPAAQRKVVIELSYFWDAVKVNKLIPACKMTGSVVSAQLSQLVKNELVDKIKGPTKDNLYRLNERFFNLWLIMTQGGPKQKREVKHLTIFFENWYDKEELQTIYCEHIKSIDDGTYQNDHAILITKALAHSKYLTLKQRDDLIEKTSKIIEVQNSDNLDYLPELSGNIVEEAKILYDHNKFRVAREKLMSLEQEDGFVQNRIGECFYYEGNIHEAEKYYLMAIEKGVVEALFNLGLMYYAQDISKAKCIELLKKYLATNANLKCITLYTIVLLWNGDMLEYHENFLKIFPELMQKQEINLLTLLFSDSLIHKQYNFVYDQFVSAEFGKRLKEMLRPLYFVSMEFVQTKVAKEELLKPGEEMQEIIKELKNYIRERQEVYYS